MDSGMSKIKLGPCVNSSNKVNQQATPLGYEAIMKLHSNFAGEIVKSSIDSDAKVNESLSATPVDPVPIEDKETELSIPIQRILNREPLFEQGVPEGSWTCSLCQIYFAFPFESIGRHMYNCIESKYNIKIANELKLMKVTTEFNQDKPNSSIFQRKGKKRKSLYKSFECIFCRKTLQSKGSLERHVLIHSSQNRKIWKCHKCPKFLSSKSTLTNHLLICKGPAEIKQKKIAVKKTYSCNLCQSVYGSQLKLDQHLEEHKSGTQSCSICLLTFQSAALLHRHMAEHSASTGNVPFQCPLCKKVLKSIYNLKKHIWCCVNTDNPLETSNAATCKICFNNFSSKYKLKTHYRVHFRHLKEKHTEHRCSKCQKYFYSNFSLGNHLQICKGKVTKKLKTGLKRSENPPPLKISKSQNPPQLQEKSRKLVAKCKICFKLLRFKQLELHMKIHTGDRPFKCSKCGKAFVIRRHMVRHSFIHTKTRQHVCKICGEGFYRSDYLFTHVKNHHPGNKIRVTDSSSQENKIKSSNTKTKDHANRLRKLNSISHKKDQTLSSTQAANSVTDGFKCKYCTKEFSKLYNLKRHIVIHTHLNLHKCRYCEMSFSFRSNMARHVKVLHPTVNI